MVCSFGGSDLETYPSRLLICLSTPLLLGILSAKRTLAYTICPFVRRPYNDEANHTMRLRYLLPLLRFTKRDL